LAKGLKLEESLPHGNSFCGGYSYRLTEKLMLRGGVGAMFQSLGDSAAPGWVMCWSSGIIEETFDCPFPQD